MSAGQCLGILVVAIYLCLEIRLYLINKVIDELTELTIDVAKRAATDALKDLSAEIDRRVK